MGAAGGGCGGDEENGPLGVSKTRMSALERSRGTIVALCRGAYITRRCAMFERCGAKKVRSDHVKNECG